MKRRKLIEVDPEFAKLVDELADDIASNLGINNNKGRGRKISSRIVTKHLAKNIRGKKRFEL